MTIRCLTVSLMLLAFAPHALADIVSSDARHYVLRIEGHSQLSPQALWARLIRPQDWWHPDHTYSGDAGNLSLTPSAGGLWREEWVGGSVAHGRVMLIQPEKVLRMEAPFGPLLAAGAYTIWSVTVAPAEEGGGSRVIFDEVASGPPSADLAELAKAVHFVKEEAMRRLVSGD